MGKENTFSALSKCVKGKLLLTVVSGNATVAYMENVIIVILLILGVAIPLLRLHFMAGGVSIRFDKIDFAGIKQRILSHQREDITTWIKFVMAVTFTVGISTLTAVKIFGDWIYLIITLPFVVMALTVMLGFYYWARSKGNHK